LHLCGEVLESTSAMMDFPQSALFREAACVPEPELRLLDGALAIASAEYPSLSIDRYRTQLDHWGRELAERLEEDASAEQRLRALNNYLFEELGFSGNIDDYYDPRNSYLNEVLDRKLGIPITLSVIYMELGQRIGLPLEGVSFPGHFLVKLPVDGGAVVLDPFNRGISLGEDDLLDLVQRMFDTEVDEVAPLLATASKHDILVRMLRNLKAIHQHAERYEKALNTVNMLLTLEPDLVEEYRDRGVFLEKLECHRAAREDFERYLRARPEADDADQLRELVVELAGRGAKLH
jgi:regulator of sirC expression with transglutaminase-like and TPR domain